MTDAEELARLELEINVLGARVEQARQAWAAAESILTATRQHRDEIARQVRAQQPSAPPAQPPFVPPPVPAEAPPAPETSTRTVQNVLFILGGLLLGTAAVVFTAVAWATFGVSGRAAILAVVTALALGAPLVALRRGLTATAETFAAVGLLLVVLDGYAGWAVNLLGVASLPASRYAAAVCLVTAVVSAGYRTLTGLAGPSFVAVIAIQPVLPLFAVRLDPGAAGWSAVAAGVSALNLLIAWRSREPGAPDRHNAARPDARATAMSAMAWLLYAAALAVAASVALAAEIDADTDPGAAWAGTVLVLAALVLVAAAALTRSDVFRALAGCLLVLAVIVAGGRFVAVAWPGYALALVAAVVAGAAVLAVAGARLLPDGVRPGPVAGAAVGAGVLAAVLAALALMAAVDTVSRAMPMWHAPLATEPRFDWQVLVSLGLAAVAILAAVPHRWRIHVVAVSAVLAVLALPDCVSLAWWAPSVVDLAAVVVLAGRTLLPWSSRAEPLFGGLAGVLTVHAVLTSLARPENTAAILGVLAALGMTIGIIGHRRAIGGWASLVGLLALPPAVGSALLAPDIADAVPSWWAARGVVAAVGVVLAGLLAVRRWRPDLTWYAYGASIASAVIWPTVVALSGVEPVGIYGGLGLLLIAAALLLVPGGAAPAVAGIASAPGALLLAAHVLPAVLAVVALPYTWIGSIWSGVPAGAGLVPAGIDMPSVLGVHAVALALLALAAATAGYAVTRRIASAIGGLGIGGPTAILVALVAAGAPWPTVPAVTLALGLVITAVAAVVHIGRWRAVTAATQGIMYVGGGLAGALTVEWATIAGLGSTVVAAAIVGAVGRTVGWRVSGWVTSVAAALATAAAAGLAADLRVQDTAFPVLAVAVLALALDGALRERRRAESTAVRVGAHAGAVVALLLTVGWVGHAAAVSTLWGIALGLRALWPGTSRPARAGLAAAAAGWELLAWWLLLADRGVTLVEAYTLPMAAVALLTGWAALRARPELRSWVAYGPALCAALLPTLAIILTTPAPASRRLLLGAGALAIVVAGSVRRRQAPVVIGGAMLVIVALHELVLVWDLLPRWIPLAVGGLLLVGIAMTYERRRRDMTRLREAVGRMT